MLQDLKGTLPAAGQAPIVGRLGKLLSLSMLSMRFCHIGVLNGALQVSTGRSQLAAAGTAAWA